MPTVSLPQFAGKVAALAPDERLRLGIGELPALAAAVGRSPSHLFRVLNRERPASAELSAAIEDAVGVPLERIDLPVVTGKRRGRRPRGETLSPSGDIDSPARAA